MTHILRALALLVPAILVLGGCSAPAVCPKCPEAGPAASAPVRYEPAPFATLPGWAGAELAPGLRAFVAGCPRIAAASALGRACAAARELPAADEAAARRFVEETFSAWAVLTPEGSAEGLVTGYYEPVLPGSRERSARFRYPVYGPPPDLVTVDLEAQHPELRNLRLRGRLEGTRLVPYWTRGEIEAMDLRAPVLAWVEDPVELLFLQIQGSGQITLESGERLRLGYADQNGHPYRSIGRFLVERGELKLERASMQGIKAWAAANPAKLREALDANPSYVFFRELPASSDGPPGTLGVPLSAGYSLAVDPRAVPLGAPVYLATSWPLSAKPLERLMAAQDTGGAIRGAARADFFWGTGAEAGSLAGQMRQRGRQWILWPRGEPLPLL
ncbi:MAG TPA: MltA domain-containing protein [Burkholderiales bacterium]|jgi:membrane-bound lytic murein transglycosylase A|nr:MltA domain-containing protein [Burkholderiales bacterium]